MSKGLVYSAFEYGRERAGDPSGEGLVYRAQQVGTVIQAGVIGIAIILMILVYDQVFSALPIGGSSTDFANNTELQNASYNSTSTFSQGMELAPVIIIVLLAAVVIAVVQRFRT